MAIIISMQMVSDPPSFDHYYNKSIIYTKLDKQVRTQSQMQLKIDLVVLYET